MSILSHHFFLPLSITLILSPLPVSFFFSLLSLRPLHPLSKSYLVIGVGTDKTEEYRQEDEAVRGTNKHHAEVHAEIVNYTT